METVLIALSSTPAKQSLKLVDNIVSDKSHFNQFQLTIIVAKIRHHILFTKTEPMATLPETVSTGRKIVKGVSLHICIYHGKQHMMDVVKILSWVEKSDKEVAAIFNLFNKTVVEAYCSFGSQACIHNYSLLFQEEVVQPCKNTGDKASVCSSVAAPLRAKTYRYGVREGGKTAFNKVYVLYLSETVALEKDILRCALGCHKDVRTLKRLLQLALDHDPSIVKLQDVADIFNSVSENPAGQGIMLNFLLDRWEEIYSKFMPWRRAVVAAIKAAAAGIKSQRQIDQVKYLRKNGTHAKDFGDFNTVIEEAQHRIDWNDKYFQDVAKYFEEQVRNSAV